MLVSYATTQICLWVAPALTQRPSTHILLWINLCVNTHINTFYKLWSLFKSNRSGDCSECMIEDIRNSSHKHISWWIHFALIFWLSAVTTAPLQSWCLCDPNVWPFSAFWRGEGLNIWKSHDGGYSIWAAVSWAVLITWGNLLSTQRCPSWHAGMLSLDGGMEILEGSTIVLCLW